MLALLRVGLAHVRAHALALLGAIVIAGVLVYPSLSHAQTTRVVLQRDSVLLIATLPRCTTACPDSVHLAWTYGAQRIAHIVKPKAIDTVRMARRPVLDSARLTYTPFKGVPQVVAIPAMTTTSGGSSAPPSGTPTSGSGTTTTGSTPNTAPDPTQGTIAALPRSVPVTTTPGPTRTVRVRAGADLQAALNAAQPGDELVLDQGATWTGNYVLPVKAAGWVTVRAESLTAPGVRVMPASMGRAPKIVTPNYAPALATGGATAQWRLVGLEIAHQPGAAYNYGLVVLGAGTETALAALPSDIILDRVYVHGSQTDGVSRCVAFNGKALTLIDSWLAECHALGNDSQGVGGWNGPGPFLIENNHIEGAGQGIMFGGADPAIDQLSPSDITIRRNHFFKPLSWGDGRWSVKAVLELKHAKRVLYEANVLENHWSNAQSGWAIVLMSTSQYDRAPWSGVHDITIRNNIIRNSASGINISARYNATVVEGTRRVTMTNNWLDNVGRDPISQQNGKILQILGEVEDIQYIRNTGTLTLPKYAQAVIGFIQIPTKRTIITDNIFPQSSYGLIADNGAPQSVWGPDAIIARNVIPDAVGTWNGPLASGADLVALNAAIAGVVR